jgi:DNA-binding transcriptional MerR regulator
MVTPASTPAPAHGEAVRPAKSVAAFRTISEVADELEVAQHVLRFWESKFAQVRPLKRGGGRRYYRPEDVELLRQIRTLLYDEGYTIKGAQKLLRARRGRPGAEAREAAGPPRQPGLEAAGSAPRLSASELRRRVREVTAELVELRDRLRAALR